MSLLRTALLLGLTIIAINASAEQPAGPKYKPSSRSPQPLDITTNEYGYSRTAPDALSVGDVAPEFPAPSPTGNAVSLASARQHGPVAIIFYRGHW